jgi:hypothetical protein
MDRIPRKPSQKSRRKANRNRQKVSRAITVQQSRLEDDDDDLYQYTQLSAPTVQWLHVLADPRNAEPASIPDTPANLSRKVKVFAKGTMTIPAGGFGFAALNPPTGCINDAGLVISTTGAYAGTTFDFTIPAGVQILMGNSDYIQAQIGSGTNQIMYRVVGAELRVRNTTSVLNRGGSLVGIQDPRHQSLQGRSYAQVDADVQAGKFDMGSLGSKWICVKYRPLDTADTQYTGTFPLFTPNPTDQSFYMGVIGTASSTQTLDLEAWVCFEAIGAPVRGVTPSHNDPVGFAAGQAAASFHPDVFKPTSVDSSVVAKTLTRSAAAYALAAHSRIAHKKTSKKKKKKKNNSGGSSFLQDLVTTGIGALVDFLF